MMRRRIGSDASEAEDLLTEAFEIVEVAGDAAGMANGTPTRPFPKP
jgi:hypothetical protein